MKEEKILFKNMTPVGHSLTGLALLTVAIPSEWIPKKRTMFLSAVSFVLLANAPDFPVRGWGHDRYDVSHSVFSTIVGLVVLAIIYRVFFVGALAFKRLPTKILVVGGVTWASLLLLDSFYCHGKGVAVLWPIGDGRLRFPIPWFDVLRDPWSLHWAENLKVMGIEAGVYGAIFLLLISFRLKSERIYLRNLK